MPQNACLSQCFTGPYCLSALVITQPQNSFSQAYCLKRLNHLRFYGIRYSFQSLGQRYNAQINLAGAYDAAIGRLIILMIKE